MTNKVQKIREEVARIQLYTQSEVLKQILDYIDKVQEEPISIWHDANEKADIHKDNIVAVNIIGEAIAFNQGSMAICFMADYDIKQWAYVNDLLKV